MTAKSEQETRDVLKLLLKHCTPEEHLVFKRMYSPDNLDLPISECVDIIDPEKIYWAIKQCENTIKKRIDSIDDITFIENYVSVNGEKITLTECQKAFLKNNRPGPDDVKHIRRRRRE